VTTDQPETFFIAEVIREKIFLLTSKEVPYACAVRVEAVEERKGTELLYIRAVIFVEQESQKAIVIGRNGKMLKAIGQGARQALEAFFGIQVFLDLWVQVRRRWRRDEQALRELGYYASS
jgi:GTP-binding protein Era